MNIYVGNLPYTMKDEDLRATFERYGAVMSAKVVIDRETNRSKGFGFVEMADQGESEAAIKALDGQDMNGRPLRVNPAKPREGGGGGGGPRGGGGDRPRSPRPPRNNY
ncbi:MAG: RNA-binding protein [Gammaproteobacteria bacterium]|nr:RNA-binding protein [Gammaproteobacteria bacterium]